MQKYTFEVIEHLSSQVTVEADSKDEAYEKVCNMYASEEIVLDYTHITDIEILPVEDIA